MQIQPATLILAAFITLHSQSADLFIKPDEILAIVPPVAGLWAPWVKAQVLVHDEWFQVRETPQQVREAVTNAQ